MDKKKFGLGTVLYILNTDFSKTLLLKLKENKRKKFNADWGNVGGKINLGENSLENCIREAREEIGVNFKLTDPKLLYVREFPNFFNKIHAVQFVYGLTMDEQTPITLGLELESYQWFKLYHLPDRTLDTKNTYPVVATLLKSF